MLFSGIPFLYWFLPVVIILYYLAPKPLKNTVLLLSSLFFYAWGEPVYVFLMVSTILAGYFGGIIIEKCKNRHARKFFLALSVIFSLSSLIYFKYADFFINNFNRLTGLSVPFLKLALPVGISFYTFQILSYTIDVYKDKIPAQKNPIILATYVALFPQLIAGPIVRYTDICSQLQNRTHTVEKANEGCRRFITGLAKKVLIANALGELCKDFVASDNVSVLYFWINSIAYSLQIYYDFSGYSDMAIGLGKIFGFEFNENFNYPFISRSVTEFWRRWHISLGSWFRDYIYIPMGGNRVSKFRFIINIFTVWCLTGFWHGAEWNFIIWGLYFGIILIIEKFFLGRILEKHIIISYIYTIFLTVISFAVFSADGAYGAYYNIAGLIGAGDIPLISSASIYAVKNYGAILVLAVIGSTPLPRISFKRLFKRSPVLGSIAEISGCLILLTVSTAFLVDGSFNPFLYFRF